MQLGVRRLSITNTSRAKHAVELELGEIVKDPYFTLFESVGALEVSDVCRGLFSDKC